MAAGADGRAGRTPHPMFLHPNPRVRKHSLYCTLGQYATLISICLSGFTDLLVYGHDAQLHWDLLGLSGVVLLALRAISGLTVDWAWWWLAR
jgi:hypothetical protein